MRPPMTRAPICNSQFAIRNWQSLLASCVLFLALPATAETSAQEPKQYPTYECRWATGPITIDGKADEAAWQQADLLDNFGQPWLADKPKAKTTTKARLLWDRDNLYFF